MSQRLLRVGCAPFGVWRARVHSTELDPISEDLLAVEEPLQIQLAGEPLALTMRTPGQDHQLALGFLFAEGLIRSAADVSRVVHCSRPTDSNYGNVIDVLPGPGVHFDPERVQASQRRGVLSTACGVCGRAAIDDLLARVVPVAPGPRLSIRMLASSTARMRPLQAVFARTGGLHAAAFLDARGEVLAQAEDVGRHNAVDKVVGVHMLAQQVDATAAPCSGSAVVLVVSGRTSFELVHKAAMAGVRVVAGVSAPSSLAVRLAEHCNITLLGFVRDGSFNLYSHPERLAG